MVSLVLVGIGWAFAALAAAGSIYTAMTAVLALRFFDPRRAPHAGEKAPPPLDRKVSLLKPLHGAEAELRQNLAAHFLQDTALPYEIVFGVQRADDPALAVARAVMAEHPDIPSAIAVGDRAETPNRKIANLIQLYPRATGDILVLTDSDIRPPPGHLARVLAVLDQPGVGIVTCPYFGEGAGGLWADVAAMGVSYQFLPNVIAGVSLGLATPCMGSTIALRRETLERIGGFEAFGGVLADDYAMGAAVRGLGLRSRVAPVAVAHTCTEASLNEVFRHELRWARTIRQVDLPGHAGSLVTHPVPLGLIGLILTLGAPVAAAILAIAIVARFLLCAVIDHAARRRGRLPWLLPLRDMLSFVVFGASFVGQSVEWRGESFHVTAKGDLRPT